MSESGFWWTAALLILGNAFASSRMHRCPHEEQEPGIHFHARQIIGIALLYWFVWRVLHA